MYTFNSEDLSKTLNSNVQIFLEIMHKENIVTKEQLNQMLDYKIVVKNKGFWGKFYNKFRNNADDNLSNIVKLIH